MVSLADIQISRGQEPDAPMDVDTASEDTTTIGPLFTGSDDERRMQVRAYRVWLSQAEAGELPPIEGLHPEQLGDLGTNGALVDFTLGLDRPALIFLGEALAAECGEERDIFNLGDVPERSLLSRLTEHCLEVIANRAPVGFDAEFDDRDDRLVLYRSILLPFSSDGEKVDFVYGVISWKHADRPLSGAARNPLLDPSTALSAPQPQAQRTELHDLLASARELARQASQAEERSHRALYAAVSRAHDVAIATQSWPGGLSALLAEAGSAAASSAPLGALVRTVFGASWPKSRLSEFTVVLEHAERTGLGLGALEAALLAAPGGLKGVVAAERAFRKGQTLAARTTVRPGLARKLRRMTPLALPAQPEEFTLLVARRNADGTVSVLGDPGELSLLEKAAKQLISS
jgi:hypothetical protein